jgi:uncharacterized membrane protein
LGLNAALTVFAPQTLEHKMNKSDIAPQEKLDQLALQHFATSWTELSAEARNALTQALQKKPISRDLSEVTPETLTFGQRVADRVARFGGSWTFIFCFLAALLIWAALNTLWLGRARAFDPYPFILLNLFLSMIAALQAPVIMMSQNRLAEKDREAAAHDYEVNLKAEIEIMALHDKLEQLRTNDLKQILEKIEKLESARAG